MYNLGNLLSMDAGFRECCKNTKRPRIPHLSPIFNILHETKHVMVAFRKHGDSPGQHKILNTEQSPEDRK